jgi:hypothetical protein
MQTLETGDLFERTHANWLRSKLPSYEQVWGAFIGNGSHNQQLNVVGVASDREAQRKLFAQAHYSFALSSFQIDRIADSALEERFPSKPSLAQYLAGHETLFLFKAYVGHVRDMFMQMENNLSPCGTLSSAFQDFYAQRSHVIHGPMMPIGTDELSWRIPLIAGQNRQATQCGIDFSSRSMFSGLCKEYLYRNADVC